MADTYDVLVAGGALVGATFAACLSASPEAASLRIGVIDPSPPDGTGQSERFDPKVVALTEASRQLLLDARIWTDAVAAAAAPYVHMEVRDGEGTGFIEFDCTDVHQPNLGHIVENAIIVAAAHRQLDLLPNVDVIRAGIDTVLGPGREDAPVRVGLNGGARLEAPLLVAADGANSRVRKQCGFGLRTWDYGHSAVIATIETEKPHLRTACQWFTAHGPLAFLPLREESGGHYVSIVWSQEHDVANELMALSEEEFCARLSRASELRLGQVLGVSRRYCVPLRQRHATDYVKPGVALIGDAAHTIHPLAGQGVNLGFGDVSVLVEELSRGLQRGLALGDASVLGRFQRRRKPDNLAMMAAMEGFKRLFAQDDPVVRILRNRGMSGLNSFAPVKNRLIRLAMGF